MEPQLLRRLRIECLQDADVSVEQELWFSDLVASRGKVIEFSESASRVLREILKAFAAEQPEIVLRARRVTAELHAGLSPVLRLEDELAWDDVLKHADKLRDNAQKLLQSVQARRAGVDQLARSCLGGTPQWAQAAA